MGSSARIIKLPSSPAAAQSAALGERLRAFLEEEARAAQDAAPEQSTALRARATDHRKRLQGRLERIAEALLLPDRDRRVLALAGAIYGAAYSIRPADAAGEAERLLARFAARQDPEPGEVESTELADAAECLVALRPGATAAAPSRARAFHDAVASLDLRKRLLGDLAPRRALLDGGAAPELDDLEWIDAQVRQLRDLRFHTLEAKARYEPRRARGIRELLSLRSLLAGGPAQAERPLFTIYRTASRNLVDLMSIADKKAGLLISTNAIGLSLLLFIAGNQLLERSWLWWPAAVFALTCALTVIVASLAARPGRGESAGRPGRPGADGLTLFQQAAHMQSEEFIEVMRRMTADPEFLERNLLEELHFYSRRVQSQFRRIRVAYTIMATGVATATALTALLAFNYLN